jgi:hypothetical protein
MAGLPKRGKALLAIRGRWRRQDCFPPAGRGGSQLRDFFWIPEGFKVNVADEERRNRSFFLLGIWLFCSLGGRCARTFLAGGCRPI